MGQTWILQLVSLEWVTHGTFIHPEFQRILVPRYAQFLSIDDNKFTDLAAGMVGYVILICSRSAPLSYFAVYMATW